jgi:nitric oxide reductase large subunit
MVADDQLTPAAAQQRGTHDMQALIWIGAFVSLLGVAGLGYCVVRAMKARRAGLDDEAMRAELQRVVVINMAALGVSALGLMMVVFGILLG